MLSPVRSAAASRLTALCLTAALGGCGAGNGSVAPDAGAGLDAAPQPCVPSCAGRACGDDTCGGSCGSCETGDTCVSGACIPASGPRPFGGARIAIPGTLEAEDFDLGGEGVAYHDTTPGNIGGAYRSEDVDVHATPGGGGHSVGWTAAGEWLGYSVQVEASGTYLLTLRASATAAQTLHLEIDGAAATNAIAATTTPDYTTFATTVVTGVQLAAGPHFLKIVFDTGDVDVDSVTLAVEPPVPPSCRNDRCEAAAGETCSTCWEDCGTCPPPGKQYFVSVDTGDDTFAGTLDRPWKTLQKAMDSAEAGSTVNIRGGTYRETLVLNVSGTAGAPITFQPYGFVGKASCGGFSGTPCAGETVVLDYAWLGTPTSYPDGGDAPRTLLAISNKRHVVIQGLTMANYTCRGYGHFGIRVDQGSEDVKFRWMKLEHLRNVSAVTSGELHAARIHGDQTRNVEFSYCEFGDIMTRYSEALTWTEYSSNALAEHNYFHDTDGIALSTYVGAHHYVFRENKLERIGLDGRGIALYNDGGNNGVIERNVVLDSDFGIENLAECTPPSPSLPNGYVVPPVHHIIVRNNLLVRVKSALVVGTHYFFCPGYSLPTDQDVYNNTIVDCGTGIYVRPFDAATTRVRNNVVANCQANYVNPDVNGAPVNTGAAFDYNLYFGSGAGPDLNVVRDDPRFANPSAGDYGIASGPAVDAGDPATTTAQAGDTDLLGRPRFAPTGGRVDLGAVELQP